MTYPDLKIPEIVTEKELHSILNVDDAKVNFRFIECVLNESVRSSSQATHPDYDLVVQNVQVMINAAFDTLKSQHKAFRHCSVIEMGSICEGTKIGEPDEFDFMIELPCFSENFKVVNPSINFYHNSDTREICVKNRDIFNDFIDLDLEEEKDSEFLRNLWNVTQLAIADALKENALPDWKWLDTIPGFMTTLAQTQTLLWTARTSSPLVVHVDVCLCFRPNKPIRDPTDSFLLVSDTDCNTISTENNVADDGSYFILRFNGHGNWTRAHNERQVWKSFPNTNGRKILYRALKFAVSKLIPGKYHDGVFRLDSLIPSYWIKTVLNYITFYLQDDSFWEKGRLPVRFVEVFLMIKKCILEKNLSSFSVPYNNLSKLFPWTGQDEDVKEKCNNLMRNLNSLIEVICSAPECSQADILSEILFCVKESNKKLKDDGLFKSVVELCYFYAYNDFGEENYKALKSFVELFVQDRVVLRGERVDLEVFYDGEVVNINEKITDFYGDDQLYFCETQ